MSDTPNALSSIAIDPEVTNDPLAGEGLEISDAQTAPATEADIAGVHAQRGNITEDERKAYMAEVERIRAHRKAFGAQPQKLYIAQRAGYKRYWFNDAPGRLELAKANGWKHVLDKQETSISRVVGTGRDGGAQRAFAMEIPQIFWDEDQDRNVHKRAQAGMDEIKNRPIRAKPGQAQASDKGKFYSPAEEGALQIGTVTQG
jgi:hypothetical protein